MRDRAPPGTYSDNVGKQYPNTPHLLSGNRTYWANDIRIASSDPTKSDNSHPFHPHYQVNPDIVGRIHPDCRGNVEYSDLRYPNCIQCGRVNWIKWVGIGVFRHLRWEGEREPACEISP